MTDLNDIQPTPDADGGDDEFAKMRASMREHEPEFYKVMETLAARPNFRLNRHSRLIMHAPAIEESIRRVGDDYWLGMEIIPEMAIDAFKTPNNHLWRELSNDAATWVVLEEARRMMLPMKTRHWQRAASFLRGMLEVDSKWFPDDHRPVYAFDDGSVLDIDGLREDVELSDYVLDDSMLPASDPDSSLPLYKRWLANYEGDTADLERTLAYILFTRNEERRMFLLWGATAGGKSVGLEMLTHLMHGQVHPWSSTAGNDNFRFAGIEKRRLLAWDEVGRYAKDFPAEDFKQLSSGSTVRIRNMRQAPTDYEWHGHIVMTANDPSGVPTNDPAILDRLSAYRFTRTVPAHARIPLMAETIVRTEGKALLLRLQKIAVDATWSDDMGEPIIEGDPDTPNVFIERHFDIQPEPTIGCMKLADIRNLLEMDSAGNCHNGCDMSVPYIPTTNQNLETKLKAYHGQVKIAKIRGAGAAKHTNLIEKKCS